MCIGCHKDQAEVQKTDHNLIETAPEARNAAGRTPFESGVCGACHLVHNGTVGIKLWARDLGEGENMMDRMCNSCHSKTGAAARKVPQVSPIPTPSWSTRGHRVKRMPPVFPLFDKNTAKHVKAGNISCPTCHDAHRWTANSTGGPAQALPAEGDAVNSFLRPHLADRVCKDCHGVEALYKFKYFHKPTTNAADDRKSVFA